MPGLSVTLVAGADPSSSRVDTSGTVAHVITDAERTAFNIQDASLKGAVNAFFGQTPDDAFLSEPTPWNLYGSYGWPQVQTTLVAQSAQIVGVTSNPTIMRTNKLTNNSNVPATFEAKVTEEVSTSTEESWSTTDAIEVSQTISYDVSFLGTGASGETAMSYSHSWEEGKAETESFTLGSASGVSVVLEPNQSVEAILSASRGVMTVQIVWKATLSGMTAINYGDTFKGHHFWGLDLGGVMQAGGLPNQITWTETIEIDYFTNATVQLNPLGGGVVKLAL